MMADETQRLKPLQVRVVFIDRDGVVNKYPGDFQYVKSWEEFTFLPKAKSALKKLTRAGFKIFVISNQAGVSKGTYSQESLDFITRNMLQELEACGIHISGVYYCTHRQEDNCSCRKPKTGLLDLAQAKLKEEGMDIQREGSFFIGDSIIDVQTGKAAGLATVLVFSGREKPENKPGWQSLPNFTASDLSTAVDLILNT